MSDAAKPGVSEVELELPRTIPTLAVIVYVIVRTLMLVLPLAPRTPSPCTQGEGRGEGSSGSDEMHPLPHPLPGYRERENAPKKIRCSEPLVRSYDAFSS